MTKVFIFYYKSNFIEFLVNFFSSNIIYFLFSFENNKENNNEEEEEFTKDKKTFPNKTFTGIFPSSEEILDKYSKGNDVYLEFINEASERTKTILLTNPEYYVEIHHIIPRFEGGTNEPNNLVQLTYNDHVIAHYIRWVIYKKAEDKIAWSVMSNQSVESRIERASLGGKIGGVISQEIHKENKTGFFNPEKQRIRGQKGAEVNRNQKTGAFDPKNLEKANKVLNENPELYLPQRIENLQKGLQTQKEKGINIGNPTSQRLKSLKRLEFLELNGIKYSLNKEHRTYISETAFDYYVLYAPKKTN